MARLRWGADAPQNVDSARVRLLDAAEACFDRVGVTKTTIEDVAKEARVSRATVYRYFDGRDELVLGVLMRDAHRFMERLQRRLGAKDSLADAIVDGILFTVDVVRADANLSSLFAPDAAGFTESVAGKSEALFSLTSDFLRPYFEAARAAGQLRDGIDIDEATEWILRTIMSLLTVRGPRKRSTAEQRRFLLTFVVPGLAADPPPPPPAPARRRQRRA